MDVLDSQGLNLATLEPYDAKTSHSLVGSLANKSFDSLAAFALAAGPEVISIQAALTGETAISTDRIAASTATTTSLNSGDSITGFVNSRGDHDWLRVQLTAGSRYRFNLNRLSGSLDPLLSLRNSAGSLISENNDANGGRNSELIYTASSSGTYFLDAGANRNNSIGQYQLLMSQLIIDQYAANTSTTGVIADGGNVTSTIDSNGDHDWFRIALTAGRSYSFNLNQVVGSQGLADPLLALRDSNGVVLTSNDDANGSMNSQINFTATSTGTYYLDAGAYADSGTGQYQLLMSQLVMDQYAANTGTTGVIAAGGSVTSTIDSNGDHDWFRVALTAGSSYTFNLNRVVGSQGLADPLLALRNSNGVVVTSNDDANGSLNSQINFTATSTGTYYLDAGAYADSGTGQYQLLMSQLIIDQYAANTSTTGVIADGGSVTSTIDSNGDHDWFRIALTAGRSYSFNLNQVVGSQGLADPLLALRDSNGVVLTSNDDANGSMNSQINFTATSTGTYYLDAGAYADSGTGQYQLLAAEAAAPTPGYSSVTGYGEASVRRALEAMLNTSLPSVADLGGIFWGLDRLGAPEAWTAGYTGSGITVAVVDTGVDYTHSDLDGNIWINSGEIAGNGIDDDRNGYIDDVRGWNFDANSNNVMDDNSHGTHVAGTIAAENNGVGITGVAYNARIMAVKVLSASGSGTLTAVANGIRYAADNGARVINLSLGGGGSAELLAAVSYATSRGAVVVMAAGNEGATSPSYPAAYAQSYGLAVGAIDSAGNLASFSNRAGSTPLDYITAAGVSVFSSVPGGGYASYSGTSMATPHIAGAMALLQQANIQNNKGLSVAALETLITSSASNMVTATSLTVSNLGTTGSSSTLRTRSQTLEDAEPNAGNQEVDHRWGREATSHHPEAGFTSERPTVEQLRTVFKAATPASVGQRADGSNLAAGTRSTAIPEAMVSMITGLSGGHRFGVTMPDPLTGLNHDLDSALQPWFLAHV